MMTARHNKAPKAIIVALVAGLALLLTAGTTLADMMTPRAAQRSMAAAGYSGVGGVTRSGPYYFAAAISPRGRRVRVGVDGRSGEIASVVAIRPGGSLTPETPAPKAFQPPRIDAQMPPLLFDPYIPPSTTKPIGAPTFPFPEGFGRELPENCRFMHPVGC